MLYKGNRTDKFYVRVWSSHDDAN